MYSGGVWRKRDDTFMARAPLLLPLLPPLAPPALPPLPLWDDPPPPPPSALPYTHSPFVLLLLPPGLLPFCCCHDLCVKVCGFLM